MAGRKEDRRHITETTLTLEKRILLHLLRSHGLRDDYEVPLEMSQEGIGKIFSVRQSSVSRVINKMLKEELVNERPAYVSGSKQKRKVYFLTHKGYQYALDTRRALETRLITLLIDNEPVDVELRKVNEHLRAPMDILDIIRNLGPRGELDVSTLVKMEPRTKKAPVMFGDPLPKGRPFIGRVRELRNLERWISSSTVKVVLVHGVAGIGKTALATRMLDGLRGKDVFYFRSRQWSTLPGLLGTLGSFLSRTGRRGLVSKVRTDGPMDLKEILSIFETEIRDLDALLIFDDFHKCSDSLLAFFTELIEILPRTKTNAMILTRYALPFYDRSHVVVKGVVKEMRLEGLTKKDCDAVLKDKGLDRRTVDHVYKVTGGHPLSLELIGVLGNLKEVDKFVFEEICSTLTSQEKKVLQLNSIMRYPVPMDVLLQVGSNEVVDELVKKAMLREVGEGLEVQDLLREFFHSRTSPKVQKELHEVALGHYRSQAGPKAILETVFHLFYSGKEAEAIDRLWSKSDQLVQEGNAGEMIALVDRFGSDIPREKYRDAHHLREKAANLWGTWDNFIEYIFECQFLEGLLPYQLKAPSKELRTSFLGRSAEDTEDALKDLQGSLAVLGRIGDEHGIGHTRYTMAWIRWARGEFTKARQAGSKIIESNVEDELKARTMMLLGGVELEAGRYDGSRDWFTKAQRSYSKMKSAEGQVQASVFEASARLLSMMRGAKGPDARVMTGLKKRLANSLETAKENHLTRATAYCEMRLAQALVLDEDMKELASGRTYAERAERDLRSLSDPTGAAFAGTTKAIIVLRSQGEVPKVIEGLTSAQVEMDKACLDRLSGVLYLHLEKIYSGSGDTFGADSSRKEAERLGVMPRRR